MDIIQKATIHFLQNQGTFYAHMLYQMHRVETKSLPPNCLAATEVKNGRITLYTDCDRLEDLSIKDVMSILEHEIMHVLLLHFERRNYRNPDIYNHATDLAINSILGHTFKQMLLPGRAPYSDLPKGKDAEWYYDKIKSRFKKIPCVCDQSKWKDESNQMDKEVVKQAVADAYHQSKNRGDMTAELTQLIEELINVPTLDWKRQLRQVFAQSIKSGCRRSWKRENRILGDIEKGRIKDYILKVTVFFDTSGSMSDMDLAESVNELKAIQKIYKHKMLIGEVDSDVKKIYYLQPNTKIDLNFAGRGGTDFRPAFDYISKMHDQPDLFIYFTDLQGTFPDKPRYRTVWVTPSQIKDVSAPFGKILHIQGK